MPPDPTLRVRPAVPGDASAIVEFVRGLARFENEPVEHVRLTEADVVRDGFGARPAFEVVIAEHLSEGHAKPIGFALFFPNYSTWEGRPGIYIEDLFVDEKERGTGAGRAILAAVAQIAWERGAARIDLAVLDWNPARGFYEALGMSQQDEWLPYRMERDAIARLATEAAAGR
ncbi:MAG: GNAT family N-acetyltransferase [Dehalococcoidia bacterium]|nr:MAG: GNAT family N-acetyltransferase [Dehalococcoidia bacterium]